jgi:RNA polymerase primary sigma factor
VRYNIVNELNGLDEFKTPGAQEMVASTGTGGGRRRTADLTKNQGKPKKTFRRGQLETGFIEFCQLSTENSEMPLSQAEFVELQRAAADFIDSEDFRASAAEREILGDDFLSKCDQATGRRTTKRLNLPPHLASLCEEQLLTPDQERQLFQRMNFLRFKADHIVSRLSVDSATQWDIERVQGLLRAAKWYRDCIVKANVRLVISVVKKFANQQCGFDDLLSDGIMALIRAVDKFDYKLGFRFSTYATQVVRRNSYRFVMDRQDERFKVSNSISDQGLDIAEDVDPSSMSEGRWNTLRGHLRDLMENLDRREKFIIRARFSLGGHRRVQTLQKLADRLQISKERVRQLEKRAMEKLHLMAIANPPDVAEIEA